VEIGLLALITLITALAVRSRLIAAMVVILVGILVGILDWRRSSGPSESLATYRPTPAVDGEYRSSKACRGCHPDAYDSWRATYHRKMTQSASKEAVVGRFDGQELIDGERSFRVFREGDRFLVDMPAYGSSGAEEDARRIVPVVMTTGSHHMQAYWVPVPWFDETPSPTDRAAFNASCGKCHGEDGHFGDAGGLIDGYMVARDVESMFTSEKHPEVKVSPDQQAAALRFATRVQYTGRLMQFPFVWLVKYQRWAHEDHTFLQPEAPPTKDEPFGDQWSDGCDQCHAVHANFQWQGQMNVGQADVAELGIACEACHGPGRAHIERFSSPVARYQARLEDENVVDDIINPSTLDHRKSSAVCAQCHAELVVREDQDHFVPGAPLDSFADVVQYLPTNPPQWLADALVDEPSMLKDAFWRDGTIRVAGRDYNGMAITGCFTAGTMGCLSCHQMHGSDPNDQLSPEGISEKACKDCHPKETLNLEAHTHHGPDSEGSRCYNCHMPHTTVGLLGLIRAHRVDSPKASVTAWSGRPNACNLCHIDKTVAEIGETLTEWYGHEPIPEMSDDFDAALTIAHLLRGDAVQRATAAWHMGWGPAMAVGGDHWQARYLAVLLEDPYAAVRAIAYEMIKKMPGFADFEYDYTGTDAHRAKSVDRAKKIWAAQGGPQKDEPALLFEGGEVDESKIDTLRGRRDNTFVRVNE